MNIDKIDAKVLKSIAHENQNSEVIFKYLRERQRTRPVMDLRQVLYKICNETGDLLKMEDVMHTFRRLQDIGVGSIIIGRGSRPNRFKWNYSIQQISKLAGEDRRAKKSKSQIETPIIPIHRTKRATDVAPSEKVSKNNEDSQVLTPNFQRQPMHNENLNNKGRRVYPNQPKLIESSISNPNEQIGRSASNISMNELHSTIANAIQENGINVKNINAMVSATINLRDGITAKVELPFLLSKDDAEKISEVIFGMVQPTQKKQAKVAANDDSKESKPIELEIDPSTPSSENVDEKEH
jgi:hypothetical protein